MVEDRLVEQVLQPGMVVAVDVAVLQHLLAVFAGGLATAIVFTLDANSKFRTADETRAKLSATGCISPSTGTLRFDCAALSESAESGDRSRNLATAGFIVAGAALVGTLTYWLWPSNGEKATASSLSSIHISPSLTDHASSLVMSGVY